MQNNSTGHETFSLQIPGLTLSDLRRPEGLRRVHAAWIAHLGSADSALLSTYERACANGSSLHNKEISVLLCDLAPHVSVFVAWLFGPATEEARRTAYEHTTRDNRLFSLQDRFVKRWVNKQSTTITPRPLAPPPMLHGWDGSLDRDLFCEAVLGALDTVELLSDNPAASSERTMLQTQLETLAQWVQQHRSHLQETHGWIFLAQPQPVDFARLVPVRKHQNGPVCSLASESPQHHRDGFDHVDPGWTRQEAFAQVDYCLYCHDREKDSCRKGLYDKEGTQKTNPLGISLHGCPLDERISEMHWLRKQGDPLAALAVICVDNPLCAGTGHRICNDCTKSCIFQKQEPVRIPLTETSILQEVLGWPWGPEIYGLLTSWNPLNFSQPLPLPYNGKNVLVVGLGPAGYTLCHHLARDGFGVVGIDGLKLEPPPEPYAGDWMRQVDPVPLYTLADIQKPASERLIRGFGGVSEYGITARWDKNNLDLIYLTLARNPSIRFFGGVRFGGTLTLEEAWSLGFDHVALATGAGSPQLLSIPHGSQGGVRTASDFLMSLQLGGAFQPHGLNNLEVQLPAWVIGGGLTAMDTATELAAYYITFVEKIHNQFRSLSEETYPLDFNMLDPDKEANNIANWVQKIKAKLSSQGWKQWHTYMQHGYAVYEERLQAQAENRPPRFGALIDAWGGVHVAYRRNLQQSPAYRLNHEEVAETLAQGIRFVEHVTPQEIQLDAEGAICGLVLQKTDGSSGETLSVPARSVWLAMGTQPNTGYEKEYPGHFSVGKNRYFVPHAWQASTDGTKTLMPNPDGFFTSYQDNTRRCVSFFGDAHPVYAGSVVKAMASAKKGHREIVSLLSDEIPPQTDRLSFSAFCDRLSSLWEAHVVHVQRLTPTIVELIVQAPAAAARFRPGQFFRLQNMASHAPRVQGKPLLLEALALTGASASPDKGTLSLIVLEMGTSSLLSGMLQPGDPVCLMGPTGTPTALAQNKTVCLVGGGLGNAVLLSIGMALKQHGCKVLYVAGYRNPRDRFKPETIEAVSDQVIWAIEDRQTPDFAVRPQDHLFRGNVVDALLAHAQKNKGPLDVGLDTVDELIVIGSDRMMAAVQRARGTVLAPYLKPGHTATASINSPMMCMMKEICAQCIQRHVDPATGQEQIVYSCVNQDQPMDCVDFDQLRSRLQQNSIQETLSRTWFETCIRRGLEASRDASSIDTPPAVPGESKSIEM